MKRKSLPLNNKTLKRGMNEDVLDEELVNSNIVLQDDLRPFERLKSMLMDHFILSFVLIPIIIIPFGITLLIENDLLDKILLVLVFSIYLNKDILRGRSPAKRMFGQVVIDYKSKKPANELRCTISNFTAILWPLECVVVVFNPNRRIGDFIAGTQVMRSSKEEAKNIVQEIKTLEKLSWPLSLGLSIIYIIIIFQMIDRISPF